MVRVSSLAGRVCVRTARPPAASSSSVEDRFAAASTSSGVRSTAGLTVAPPDLTVSATAVALSLSGRVDDDERVALTESEMEALEPPANALGDLRDGVSSTAPTSTLNALDAVQRVRGFKQELGHISPSWT
jgi:hypothetical protein